MRNGDLTRATILDAAEALFAVAGFDVVSMRDVAAKADVPLGLINYHFRSKEKLFEAIIARRADELNDRRQQAFDAIQGKPCVRDIIDVFFRPYLELMLRGGPGWRSYGKLLAQTGQNQRWIRLIARQFDRTQHLILDALLIAEPRLTRERAVRGYAHMVSVMFGLFAANDLLSIISKRAHNSRDLKQAYEHALPFLVGAFEGLAGENEKSARRSSNTESRKRLSA